MDDRPVVVSSLLSFIHNYRNEPDLERIVDKCFSAALRSQAYTLLQDLLSELCVENGHHDPGVKASASTPASSLIAAFDRVTRTEQAPVFAADNLAVLPITLSPALCYDDSSVLSNGKPKEALVFHELRQIRMCLQRALGQQKYAAASDESREATPEEILRSSAKDAAVRPATPVGRPLAINASSPESPLDARSSKAECRSPTTTDISAASTSVDAPITSSNASPSEHESQSLQNGTPSESPTSLRRKCEGNRLDRAVRKLTDRLESKVDTVSEPTTPNEPEDLSKTSTANHISNKEEGALIGSLTAPATPTQPPVPALMHARSFLNVGGFLPAGFPVNPAFNYFEMLKNSLANSQNMANYAFQSPLHHLDRLSSAPTKTEIASPASLQPVDIEDDDKMSNESSPTPSDASHPRVQSRNGDDVSVGDSADKPFACSQPNCHKRFSNKFLLKKHTFIHTGERPHTCPFCSKRFNRKDNLLRHKKTHISNSVAQFEGRRRHNMLPGVSAEDVATLGALALMREQATIVVDNNDVEMQADD